MSSLQMRAVAETWFGSTDEFIDDKDDLLQLLRGVATYGIENNMEAIEAVSEEDNHDCTDLILFEAAATPFLDLLDDPVELRRVSDAVIAENELTVDAESLGYLLGNLHNARAEYRKAYELDGDMLRFRID